MSPTSAPAQLGDWADASAVLQALGKHLPGAADLLPLLLPMLGLLSYNTLSSLDIAGMQKSRLGAGRFGDVQLLKLTRKRHSRSRMGLTGE